MRKTGAEKSILFPAPVFSFWHDPCTINIGSDDKKRRLSFFRFVKGNNIINFEFSKTGKEIAICLFNSSFKKREFRTFICILHAICTLLHCGKLLFSQKNIHFETDFPRILNSLRIQILKNSKILRLTASAQPLFAILFFMLK